MHLCIRLFVLLLLSKVYLGEDYVDNLRRKLFRRDLPPVAGQKIEKTKLYLNESFFPALINSQVNASLADESDYLYVARVVHSTTENVPVVCTAVCLDSMIFITAARCIWDIKVTYTTLIYKGRRLFAKSFVLPSKTTKQLFDDVGFIVTERDDTITWTRLSIYPFVEKKITRLDNNFDWFVDWENNYTKESKFKVVGYATEKEDRSLKLAVKLYDLDVIVSSSLCHTISTFNHKIKGLHVPCYHSCTIEEHNSQPRNTKCDRFLGAEGGAVLDDTIKDDTKLIGIATFGGDLYFKHYQLPCGFSVLNSPSYEEDLRCASRISKYEGEVSDGVYQSLCDGDDERKIKSTQNISVPSN